METTRLFRSGAFVLAIAIAGLIPGTAGATEVKKVRWLLAHQPADAFRRAAKTFNDELKRETHGQMEIVVLEPKDVGSKTESMDPKRIFELLANGDVEMSQTVSWGIGQIVPRFYALDLPFLFKDHEHAAKVLEGKVGRDLLASLDKKKIHGLAFTYSGGFRVIPSSDRALHTLADFKGLRVRSSMSPVAQATLRAVRAVPVPMYVDNVKDAVESGKVDAAETTYIRVSSVFGDNSKYLNETEHSLFLTSILASSKFFNSLTKEQRKALSNAAMAAARIEREDSVNDGKRVRAEFEQKGVKVIRMSEAETAKWRDSVRPVYEHFETMFGKKWLQEIKTEGAN